MSVSEIIAERYKNEMKVNKLSTPEEAAQVVIKDTKEFDVNAEEYFEGSLQEQELYMKKLGDIQTNLAQKWKDLSIIK